MNAFPSVNILAVLLAAGASFAWGGLYWGILSPPIARVVRLDADTAAMPPTALVVAMLTRIVQAFGISAALGFAGVTSLGVGFLGGLAIFCVFLLPMMLGQAAFGPPWGSWPRLVVGLPEAVIGFGLMGAIAVLWR